MKEIELKVPNLGDEKTEIAEISKKGINLIKMILLLSLNQRKLLWKFHQIMMALSKILESKKVIM